MDWLETNLMMAPAFSGGFWLWVTRDQPLLARNERKRAAYCQAVARDFDERGIVDSGSPLPR